MQNVYKDEFWEKPKKRGQRLLNLGKVFTAIQFFLENEESLNNACVNAGLPKTSVYDNYKDGKKLAEKLVEFTQNKGGVKNKTASEQGYTEREIQQLDFFFDIERAKNLSLLRAKKYIGYTLEQSEIEIFEFKKKKEELIKKIELDGESLDEEPRELRFIPDPEIIKLSKWLLERRQKERYGQSVEHNHDGAIAFDVTFEDLPNPNEDLTESEE